MTGFGSSGFAAGLVGIVLDGRYRLDAVLGEGGMGAVFRAQQLAIDRRVAVKLLKPHLTQNRDAAERFVREARATLKVDSPHAVKVLDFGITPHGDYYMALEYLDGRTVQRELEIDGPFSPPRALHIARQALHALGAAHKRGLVHRDLKPDNLLLMRVGDDADYTKLLDFGVAKLMQGAPAGEHTQLSLTQAGTVFGTPEFMSPEQACGHPLDGRSDLYSLAATMFTMLTGSPLFEGGTAIEWLTHHVRTAPPRLAQVSPELAVYPELDELLQRCLAKQRDQRPASAEELDGLLAELEVYVARGGAHAKAVQRVKSPMGVSAYFSALPADLVDPGTMQLPANDETLAPARPSNVPTHDVVAQVTSPSDDATGLTDAVRAITNRRRVWWGVLGAVLAIGLVVVAIVATRRTHGDAAEPSLARAGKPLDNDARAPRPSASRSGSASGSASSSASVSVPASGSSSGSGSSNGSRPASSSKPTGSSSATDAANPNAARNADAVSHLRNAEAAFRDGNLLRQLAEADAAQKADPRNVRAKYLLADALIKSGDLEHGCAYLGALGRNPLAVARASSAKCPTD